MATTLTPVQSAWNQGDATATVTTGSWSTPTSGNLIVVVNGVRKGTSTTSVSVTTGGTFNLAVGEYGADIGSVNGGLWWKVSDGTESTITFTNSNSANDNGQTILACEFSFTNLDTSAEEDTANDLSWQFSGPHTTDLTTGAITNTTPVGIVFSMLVGQIDFQWTATTTVESPFTLQYQSGTSADHPYCALSTLITSSASTYTGTYNTTDTGGLAYGESMFLAGTPAGGGSLVGSNLILP